MNKINEHFRSHKKKYISGVITSLLGIGFIAGLFARPLFDRGVQNWNEMFGTVEVTPQQEPTVEQKKLTEIKNRPEVKAAFDHYVLWIFNTEKADEYRQLYEKHNAFSTVEFGRLQGTMQDYLSAQMEKVEVKKK